jgi:hypothetical protein
VVAVIVRPHEQKIIVLPLVDIDQAIATHKIEFFAFSMRASPCRVRLWIASGCLPS